MLESRNVQQCKMPKYPHDQNQNDKNVGMSKMTTWPKCPNGKTTKHTQKAKNTQNGKMQRFQVLPKFQNASNAKDAQTYKRQRTAQLQKYKNTKHAKNAKLQKTPKSEITKIPECPKLENV